MAINTSNEYEYIDIVNGNDIERHYLKDTVARQSLEVLENYLEQSGGHITSSNNLIQISLQQPSASENKIWIKPEEGNSIELITKDDWDKHFLSKHVPLTAGAPVSKDCINFISNYTVDNSGNPKTDAQADGFLTSAMNMGKATGEWAFAAVRGSATGDGSCAVNRGTASGEYSFAQGESTTSSGQSSHAEGYETIASYLASHAEGYQTLASGMAAHAEGRGTIAQGDYQHVSGMYNQPFGSGYQYLEIIGNGIDDINRSNARTLTKTGDEMLAGTLTLGGSLIINDAELNSQIIHTVNQLFSNNNNITDNKPINYYLGKNNITHDYKICALKPQFTEGYQLSSTGVTASNSKRSATKNFIHVLPGSIIAPKNNTVQYNICFYQYPRTTSKIGYQPMITDGSSYTITEECFIKIGIGYINNSKTADSELESHFTFTLLQPVEPMPMIYSMEPLALQDNTVIRDFNIPSNASAQERVDSLYTAYDNLMTSYPHWISKQILGRDQSNTYDIICYTINSHTDTYYSSSSTPIVIPHLKILLLTDIHGAEIGVPYDTYKFIKTLLEQHSSGLMARIWEHCTIKVIPTCNPWGYGNKSNLNSRDVNLNRNFPTSDWVVSGTPGDADYSGSSGGSEEETKIIMQFIRDNIDTCCLFNLHNCDSFSAGHILGYVTSAYDVDNRIALSTFHSLDNLCKTTWNYLLADSSINTYEMNLFRVSNARKVGTMDKWAAWECGVHGYLLETAPTLGEDYNNNDRVDIQNINVTTLANLIGGVVSHNKDILTDNTESILS